MKALLTVFCTIFALCAFVKGTPSTAEILHSDDVKTLQQVIHDPRATHSQIYTALARLEAISPQQPQACLVLAALYANDSQASGVLRAVSANERLAKQILLYSRASRVSDEANLRLYDIFNNSKQRDAAWLFLLRSVSLGNTESKERLAQIASTISNTPLREYVCVVCSSPSSLPSVLIPQIHQEIATFFSQLDQTALRSIAANEIAELYKNLQSAADTTLFNYQEAEKKKAAKQRDEKLTGTFKVLSRFFFLGVLGCLFAAFKSVYLFADRKDVILTFLITAVGVIAAIAISSDETTSPYLAIVPIIAAGLALIPLSRRANPGMIWSLILVIPGKMVLSALMMFCAYASLSSFSRSISTRRTRSERNGDIINGILFAVATYFLKKFVKYTTQNNE